MRSRYLLSALLVTSCVAAPNAGGPVAYQLKVQKVSTMTRTFSLSQNQALGKVAESLRALTAAFQSAFAANPKAGYALLGLVQAGQNQITFDDASKEISGIVGPDANVAFKSTRNDRTRTLDATVLGSKDGTTGSVFLELTGDWITLPQNTAYKFLGGDIPVVVDELKARVDAKPQGREDLAVHLEGSFDEAKKFPGQAFQVPTHWQLALNVPKARLTWDSRAELALGKSTLKGSGTIAATTDQGEETFEYDVAFSERDKNLAINLTNVAAKVRFELAGNVGQPLKAAKIVSTEDGKQIGTMEQDPTRPGILVIKLEDGTTMDWEVVPSTYLTPASAARGD
jgi:hypothetical protein